MPAPVRVRINLRGEIVKQRFGVISLLKFEVTTRMPNLGPLHGSGGYLRDSTMPVAPKHDFSAFVLGNGAFPPAQSRMPME